MRRRLCVFLVRAYNTHTKKQENKERPYVGKERFTLIFLGAVTRGRVRAKFLNSELAFATVELSPAKKPQSRTPRSAINGTSETERRASMNQQIKNALFVRFFLIVPLPILRAFVHSGSFEIYNHMTNINAAIER